jgi:hypothetical protein
MIFKITVFINNEESESPTEWKTVPRIGESVALNDGHDYTVKDVTHMFRRGMDAHNGEISISLEKK